MDRLPALVSFTDQQALEQSPAPTSGEPAATYLVDGDIKETNARELYCFELALPQVAETYQQAQQYATAQFHNHLGHQERAEAQDERAWSMAKIERALKDEVAEHASQVCPTGLDRQHVVSALTRESSASVFPDAESAC